MNLNSQFDALEKRLEELETRFIGPHTDPLETPSEYGLDVEVFCVFAHAAFEEFIENIILYLLEEIEDKFKNSQRFSYATLCLLHFNEGGAKIDKYNESNTLYMHLSEQIKILKGNLSNLALKNNHGINKKYLKKLLLPVGIDLPQDATILNSLDQLANIRGGYAHNFSSSRCITPPDPTKANSYVNDVKRMCKSLMRKANQMSYFKQQYI